ncbi:hypothetical protein HS7_10820 [Sulfolobales archaeon HS-7]|nr:hypothetical protein HS7_10820 [Sulfolobales archaeon HS-7]
MYNFTSEKIVLGFDETFLRVAEKEAEREGDELFSGKAKVRSAVLLSPVRCNVVTQFAVPGGSKALRVSSRVRQ